MVVPVDGDELLLGPAHPLLARGPWRRPLTRTRSDRLGPYPRPVPPVSLPPRRDMEIFSNDARLAPVGEGDPSGRLVRSFPLEVPVLELSGTRYS